MIRPPTPWKTIVSVEMPLITGTEMLLSLQKLILWGSCPSCFRLYEVKTLPVSFSAWRHFLKPQMVLIFLCSCYWAVKKGNLKTVPCDIFAKLYLLIKETLDFCKQNPSQKIVFKALKLLRCFSLKIGCSTCIYVTSRIFYCPGAVIWMVITSWCCDKIWIDHFGAK